MTSPFDWNCIGDRQIKMAVNLLVEREVLSKRRVIGGRDRYYVDTDLEAFIHLDRNPCVINLLDLGHSVFREVVSNLIKNNQIEATHPNFSITEEIVDGDSDWPPVIAYSDDELARDLKNEIASQHILTLINQRERTFNSAEALSLFFDEVISSYVNETTDNNLPEDWLFLEEIKKTLDNIVNVSSPEIQDNDNKKLEEYITDLEARIAELEETIATISNENSPIKKFLDSAAESTGRCVGPLVFIGIVYLSGITEAGIPQLSGLLKNLR